VERPRVVYTLGVAHMGISEPAAKLHRLPLRAQFGKYFKWKTEKEQEIMTEYSKYNIVYRLQKWMDSVPGQTFLNYAYSWGASIVILGTLFKLTHLPGANIMLFLGMGTEVVVFFISAFDRPFDKTAIGKELPTHVMDDDEEATEALNAPSAAVGGGTIIIGGGSNGSSASPIGTPIVSQPLGGEAVAVMSNGASPDGGAAVSGWLSEQQQTNPGLAEAQENYVEELKKLTETLQKVSEQSERLTRDSEEMETLNRTLTGICRVYEMQLKGASQQIGTIDQINEQSRRMAQLIEQLNSIYSRMIDAMTVNMRVATPGAGVGQ